MKKYKYTIAIIGKPNVGKSSLFNYFLGKNLSTIYHKPGTTKDRILGFFKINNYLLKIIDTGGFSFNYKVYINKMIFLQCLIAIKQSSVIIVVISIISFSYVDLLIIKFCCKLNKKVYLVFNKIDLIFTFDVNKYLSLYNIKNIQYISIKHGNGIKFLLKNIVKFFQIEQLTYISKLNILHSFIEKIKVAIIGRPNVGKSTFLNTLLNYSRHLTSNKKHTTTDPILTIYRYKNIKMLFTDTAGVCFDMPNSINNIFTFFSMKNIKLANISIFMTDIYSTFYKKDKRILYFLNKNKKPYLILINKIDLLHKKNINHNNYNNNMFFISSIKIKHVLNIIIQIYQVYQEYNKILCTKKLTNILQIITKKHIHFTIGKKILKIFWCKQISKNPLIFIVLINVYTHQIQYNYRKYLIKSISNIFNIKRIPVRIYFYKKSLLKNNK